MKIEQHKPYLSIDGNITLVKTNGGIHYGTQYKFVEWSGKELGSRAKQLHDEPQIGYSCIIDPQYTDEFTWLTTPITEIITNEKQIIKFKTENSEYTLYIEENEQA